MANAVLGMFKNNRNINPTDYLFQQTRLLEGLIECNPHAVHLSLATDYLNAAQSLLLWDNEQPQESKHINVAAPIMTLIDIGIQLIKAKQKN